ncbi:YesL family protein [Anaerobacillus sp. CMMVII]|uniref:YesL family protein n=1 Tax=Anaerobacillus sp. CMMVII TaxID=2755588 RepID=UPI0021B83C30|nr:YesL family protein [Anaerobacillus sp. CMMVII]MCT8137105.1 YesL family protein [Anaerobacillus sp. CMMVII]
MNVSWMSSKFYRTCEWIWRFAYVNLLWLFATLAGLVVFGILPATVAMFAVLRKWVMKEPDISVIRTFLSTYKNEFIKINVLGLIFAGIGYVIYFNFLYLSTLSGFMHTVLLVGVGIATVIYLITLFFIFPVYVHYDYKLVQYVKVAFIIGLVNPLALITLLASLLLLLYLFYLVPGLIPFFSISMIGMAIMWPASMAFSRVEQKKEKIIQKNSILA